MAAVKAAAARATVWGSCGTPMPRGTASGIMGRVGGGAGQAKESAGMSEEASEGLVRVSDLIIAHPELRSFKELERLVEAAGARGGGGGPQRLPIPGIRRQAGIRRHPAQLGPRARDRILQRRAVPFRRGGE